MHWIPESEVIRISEENRTLSLAQILVEMEVASEEQRETVLKVPCGPPKTHSTQLFYRISAVRTCHEGPGKQAKLSEEVSWWA